MAGTGDIRYEVYPSLPNILRVLSALLGVRIKSFGELPGLRATGQSCASLLVIDKMLDESRVFEGWGVGASGQVHEGVESLEL